MTPKLTLQIKKAPKGPGIYVFSAKDEVLYIGKAVNLRNRLKQYLNPVRGREGPERASDSNGVNKKTCSPFLKHILNEAEKIETKTTGSEIEALILESRLVKELQPKYNIMLRDDKQYFYAGFTKEEFPKIFLTHRPDAERPNPEVAFPLRLPFVSFGTRGFVSTSDNIGTGGPGSEVAVAPAAPGLGTDQRSATSNLGTGALGPFTDGTALKITLRLLRRIFPYCTCAEKHHNFCLNYHIGKCLGFCCLKGSPERRKRTEEIKEYQKNIKAIKDILSGRRESLVKKLRKELNQLAENQEFEKAIELRNKVEKLERVFENAKIISDANIRIHTNNTNILEEIKRTFKLSRLPRRIEGYDVSNIQGKNAVGAMVVFIDGQPDKNQYRKFKIRLKKEPDAALRATKNHAKHGDIAMLKEILTRRLRHPEWPYPDLIFIDGGKGQLNVAIKAIAFIATFSEAGRPAIISLAKGKQNVFSNNLKKPAPMKKLPAPVQNLIKQIDSEAHRFAISYYRKIHRKKLIA